MAYYSQEQLQQMGFKKLGRNVKISDKACIYNSDRIEIGENSRIDDFCVVSGKITIGTHAYIGPFSLIAGGEKGLSIGDFATIAYHVQVFTQSDDYLGQTLTNPTIPSRYKMEKKEPVELGRHVIIGAGSIVLPGVVLAEGSSIGAMSLVTKSTAPWGVYFGVPARRVMERKRELLELEKRFLADSSNDSI